MANAVRKQIRDAVAVALTGLATTNARVFENRNYELQDVELPGLRIYTSEEDVKMLSMGINRHREHTLALVVEACSKKSAGMDDELDAMVKEVLVALDANQGAGGAKYIEPKRIEVDMDGEAEKERGVARMTFEVLYVTQQGAPDVAL